VRLKGFIFCLFILNVEFSYSKDSCLSLLNTTTEHLLSNGIKVSKKTIDHIIWGDYSGDKLKSGMHTLEGLQKLLDKHSDVHDLDYIHPSHIGQKPFKWINIQNDVSGMNFVRLPKELVTSQGRKNLRAAHINHQGAYLWKTLFPHGFNESALLKMAEEAIGSLDLSEIKTGEMLYTHNAKKLVFGSWSFDVTFLIDVESKSLVTAYPSAGRPSNLLAVNKSGIIPMTRHMVTRLAFSYVVTGHDAWSVFKLREGSLPHEKNEGLVQDHFEAYEAYFNSDYFGLPLAEVATLYKESESLIEPRVMSHYRKTLLQALESNKLSLGQKILFVKKALFHIRSFGLDTQAVLYNLAIHDSIMWFVTRSLNDEDLKDFSEFYKSSPSYWYSFFPTNLISNYLKTGRHENLATLLTLLRHPIIFIFSKGSALNTPVEFSSEFVEKEIRASNFMGAWSQLYSIRISKLRMNQSRQDIDFLNDRFNHLIFVWSSYLVALEKGHLENIKDSFDDEFLQESFRSAVVSEYINLAKEFDLTEPFELRKLSINPNGSVAIPRYELAKDASGYTLKEVGLVLYKATHKSL